MFEPARRLTPLGSRFRQYVERAWRLITLPLEHRVVGRTHGVRTVRIGKADHVAERCAGLFVSVDELDRFVGQEIGRKRLFVGTLYGVGRLPLFDGLHTRAFWCIFQLFPVTSVEHVAVVVKAELALRSPLRLATAVEVPLAGVAGSVSLATQQLRKGNNRIIQGNVVGGHRRVLRIPPRHERSSRRRANGRGGVEAGAHGTVFRNPVDMGCLDYGVAPHQRLLAGHQLAVAAECAEIVFVGLDDQQIQLLAGGSLGGFHNAMG